MCLLSAHHSLQTVWKVNSALGEDCFLNAVEDLSDYKENECTVEEPEINQSLVDPLLEQTSSDHKPASLAV